MSLPSSVKYLVIGAGIHGLSSAWHLAKEQSAAGETPDVLVIDKTGVGAGASGIACGVVRNNYYQPAMSELMAANVEVWEQDPEAFSYHPVGYMALGAERQVSDLTEVLRAPAEHRLPVAADRGRGRGARLHAGDVPGLAGTGRARLPARGEGRLRQQHGLAARAGRQGHRRPERG